MVTSVPAIDNRTPPGGWEGWRHWPDQPPPFNLSRVELWRRGRPSSYVGLRNAMHPAQNVHGLYWRPEKPAQDIRAQSSEN